MLTNSIRVCETTSLPPNPKCAARAPSEALGASQRSAVVLSSRLAAAELNAESSHCDAHCNGSGDELEQGLP